MPGSPNVISCVTALAAVSTCTKWRHARIDVSPAGVQPVVLPIQSEPSRYTRFSRRASLVAMAIELFGWTASGGTTSIVCSVSDLVDTLTPVPTPGTPSIDQTCRLELWPSEGTAARNSVDVGDNEFAA